MTGNPDRLALVDFDGDSPRGRLVEGPKRIPGNIVPTTLLQVPPYGREHSDGESSVSTGGDTSTGTSHSSGVSFNMGYNIGAGFGIPFLLEASVGKSVGRTISRSHDVFSRISVGKNFSMSADPKTYGTTQAGIVLTAGCFLEYVYEVDDPSGRFGGNGETFTVLLPVGGETGLWDLRRYNAMARALGNLPIIEADPVRVGELNTYPHAPQLPNGQPIPQEDLISAATSSFVASDSGGTSWSVGLGLNQGTSTGVSVSVGTSASLGVVGFRYGESIGESEDNGYSINIGESTSFGGGIPAIPDKSSTPEDEFALNRYAFRPYVYVRHYQDAMGEDSSYYVITYAVDP
ncbi:MAG: hypothetical protein R3C68_00050 [Myxococcota bacterium]